MQAPSAPDPAATALMQAKLNQNTAIQQQQMNMMDQVTPDGSLNYTQNGTRTYVDAFGKTREIPVYTATQTLSDVNQGIYDASKAAHGNMAGIARDQSAAVADTLKNPLQLNNETTEARLYELGSKRLDPQFAQAEDAMRTRLANAGIKPGSAAFDREMANFNYGRNDAYNNLLLTGRGQAVQELLAERNQPLNELNALLTGSQVSQPQFVNTPQTQVAGVDYAGLVSDQYKAEQGAYGAMMGGLFGLGGDLASAGIGAMRPKTTGWY